MRIGAMPRQRRIGSVVYRTFCTVLCVLQRSTYSTFHCTNSAERSCRQRTQFRGLDSTHKSPMSPLLRPAPTPSTVSVSIVKYGTRNIPYEV
jgi:hypothetical protein